MYMPSVAMETTCHSQMTKLLETSTDHPWTWMSPSNLVIRGDSDRERMEYTRTIVDIPINLATLDMR